MSAVRISAGAAPRLLVIACGALAKEIVALCRQLGPSENMLTLQCLPAEYHNAPQKIAPAVEAILKKRRSEFDRVLIGYGECGTGGALDSVLERYAADRLPFAHCYEFFAGAALFNDIIEEEIGSFFLTDYLVRNFDRLVIKGLGLDRHPDLRDLYFGNYARVVHLAQTPDPGLRERAAAAAAQLNLAFDYRYVGYGELQSFIADAASADIEPGEIRNVYD